MATIQDQPSSWTASRLLLLPLANRLWRRSPNHQSLQVDFPRCLGRDMSCDGVSILLYIIVESSCVHLRTRRILLLVGLRQMPIPFLGTLSSIKSIIWMLNLSSHRLESLVLHEPSKDISGYGVSPATPKNCGPGNTSPAAAISTGAQEGPLGWDGEGLIVAYIYIYIYIYTCWFPFRIIYMDYIDSKQSCM